jgi:hypothetical protein
VFIKLKYNKIVTGVSQTQQYIILLHRDDMFRSLDNHQASYTKLALHIAYSKFCNDGLQMVK